MERRSQRKSTESRQQLLIEGGTWAHVANIAFLLLLCTELNSISWSPKPKTSKCDCLKQVLEEVIKLKWGYYCRLWTNLTSASFQEEIKSYTERETSGVHAQSDGHLQRQAKRKLALPAPWPWTSSCQNCEKISLRCLSCPVMVLHYNDPSRQTHPPTGHASPLPDFVQN